MAPSGTDEHVDAEHSKEAKEERDIALASTWHLDPALLVGEPTDSDATTAARQRLARISARLGDAVETYDRARVAAEAAALQARDARTALLHAQAVVAVATADYQRDRDLFVAMLTEAYSIDSVSAMGLIMSADTDEDLIIGLTVLQETSTTQSSAVEAAGRSRDRLQRANVVAAEAAQHAHDKLETSQHALAEAEAARSQVLEDVKAARRSLEDSVLADEAAALATLGFVPGEVGDITFPLPTDGVFVDQDNYGHRSRHWARVHTGDDFSTACGTPVLAVTDGTIMIRTDQSWSGRWLVMVATGAGRLSTWYAHMQAVLVTDGEQVTAGEPIGLVGAEGNATGCHLHFEVHPDGGSIYQDDTDPVAWLREVGAYPGEG